MNLQEIDDMVSFILNANDTQTTTEYNQTRRYQAINAAYAREWNEIQQHVARASKVRHMDFTWPSGQGTLPLPSELVGKTIFAFYNVTNQSVQPPRLIVRMRDAVTLEWGDAGPGADVSMRAEYIAAPSLLQQPSDSPDLILPQYHELIAWSAAIWLAEILDREAAPGLWRERREALLLQAIKGMSTTPLGDGTQIQRTTDDIGDYW